AVRPTAANARQKSRQILPARSLGFWYLLTRYDYRHSESSLDLGEKLLIEPVDNRLVSEAPLISVDNDQNRLAQSAQVLAQQKGFDGTLANKVRQLRAQIEIELTQDGLDIHPASFQVQLNDRHA